MQRIHDNIRFLREKVLQISQEGFAAKLGINAKNIGEYEEGHAEPRNRTLCKIAHLFDISIDALLIENLSRSWDDEVKMERLRKGKEQSHRNAQISIGNGA